MKNNTLGIISLILAFVFPVAGIILGIVTLTRASKEGGSGKGLAIAAIVIGGIFFVIGLISFIAYFFIMSSATYVAVNGG